MEEDKMISQLAEAAGMSTLELKGFYDTVKEKGYATPDEMEYLLSTQLPIAITFQVLEFPEPTFMNVPFKSLKEVFEKMHQAKLDGEAEAVRNFIITYIVARNGLWSFGEACMSVDNGHYPSKLVLVSQLSKDENVHPSSISIQNIRELSAADFADYMYNIVPTRK